MSALASSSTRGTIIKVPDSTPGLLIVAGAQKSFVLEGVWHSPVAPAPNMTVDVQLDGGGNISGIEAVDTTQLAKERLDRIGGIAQQQGKEAAAIATEGVGALAARMGTAALVATVIMWVAWFFVPFAKLDFFLIQRSFSFWEMLALNVTNPAITGSRGFLGLLGVLVLLAPVARPFVRHVHARYLNVLPLAFVVLAPMLVYWRVSRGAGASAADTPFGEIAREVAREAASALLEGFSIHAGATVLVIAAAFLAMKGLRREPAL